MDNELMNCNSTIANSYADLSWMLSNRYKDPTHPSWDTWIAMVRETIRLTEARKAMIEDYLTIYRWIQFH